MAVGLLTALAIYKRGPGWASMTSLIPEAPTFRLVEYRKSYLSRFSPPPHASMDKRQHEFAFLNPQKGKAEEMTIVHHGANNPLPKLCLCQGVIIHGECDRGARRKTQQR